MPIESLDPEGDDAFTTVPARAEFANSVVHYNVPPKPILELGEVLAGHMREWCKYS